ncbi:hypothetical protein FBR6_2747 [Lactiplantibacillus plantarum]|nr:hypothetical protein FBR6_2747 [Lactiplantibacillus plantarum]KZU76270.1 hypothetical protein Nizo2889_0834 [Lactiplantibacillus plantarum]
MVLTTISIATHVLAEAWRIDMTAHSNDFASPRNFTPNRPPATNSVIHRP